MLMIRVLTDEKHPVNAGFNIESNGKEKVVVFFGLAKFRGDNIVYTTRYTDSFQTALNKYQLTYYPTMPISKFNPNEAKALFRDRENMEVEFIGIAYNIRQEMPAATYKELLTDLGQAIA